MDMNYWRQFDGLRCFAVMLVMLQHFFPDVGFRIHAGFIGVNLFFVVSGFLITSRLDQFQKFSPSALMTFYKHRLARIIPVYYLTILFLYLFNVSLIREFGLDCLLFIFNVDVANHKIGLTPITHFWSLAVEMQFYLLWPLLLLPLAKKRKLLISIIFMIVVLAFIQFYMGIIPTLNQYRWVSLFP